MALAILGGSIVVIGELMRIGARNAEQARDLSTAQILCETKVNEIVAGLIPPQAVVEVPVEDVETMDSPGEWMYSISVDQVDQKKMKGQGNNSVGGALEHVPGLANIGTGDALGTPVIRGVSENRVRVMSDGVPVNHQQWSSRHSPNIDPAMAERVEVVRGPASVMWGPDAMGGVVNVVYRALPTAPDGQTTVHGEVGIGYFNNNDQGQGQFSL